MVGQFTRNEWLNVSRFGNQPLLMGRGWHPRHILVLDLATGEAVLIEPKPGCSMALDQKHGIWVCPLYSYFLEYLGGLPTPIDLSTLPEVVYLVAPADFRGYRRAGHPVDTT